MIKNDFIDSNFVCLNELCYGFFIDVVYATENNFTGAIVSGYKSKKAYLLKLPADALIAAQHLANKKGFSLKIFDAYRPVKAVESFINWAEDSKEDINLKNVYYPKFTKNELFEKGFLAKKSSHSRGVAVDLTLVDMKTGLELDMGTSFDFFDEISHTESHLINREQYKNRMLLKEIMGSQGFINLPTEWWHYSFLKDINPDKFYDFDVI
jgi:D-alanyl-D-alanine dipeptidase